MDVWARIAGGARKVVGLALVFSACVGAAHAIGPMARHEIRPWEAERREHEERHANDPIAAPEIGLDAIGSALGLLTAGMFLLSDRFRWK